MNADHILTCHGLCRADRERMLETYPGLKGQLEKLPDTYRANDVAAAIDSVQEANAKPQGRKAAKNTNPAS